MRCSPPQPLFFSPALPAHTDDMINHVEVEEILARVSKEKTHRVDVQDLRPPSQQALVVVHHVGDVLPVEARLLFV